MVLPPSTAHTELIHLPTATFYVCAKCDTRFNQFWDWAPICPNCNHGSHKCVNGVTETSVRQHITIQQERRVQTECLHRPLDTVLMAVSGNFVSGTASGPLSYASQWLRTAKVEAYARYEDKRMPMVRRPSTSPNTVTFDTKNSRISPCRTHGSEYWHANRLLPAPAATRNVL
jgi:hypothetical protein